MNEFSSGSDGNLPEESEVPNNSIPFEGFLHLSAARKRWAIILITPESNSESSSSNSGNETANQRPLPFSKQNYLPGGHGPLLAKAFVADKIMLWCRAVQHKQAAKYTSFFPIDGAPHFSLLDPRFRERLAVWDNASGNDFERNDLYGILWSNVLEHMEKFLASHSLDGDTLGPLHRNKKSMSVSTRRPTPTSSPVLGARNDSRVQHSEEDASFAAAVAASLAEAGSSFSALSAEKSFEAKTENTSNAIGQTTETHTNDYEAALDEDPQNPRMSKESQEEPSEIHRLSESYLTRMESVLRSHRNPELREERRLRQEQDEQLKQSIRHDLENSDA